MDAGVIDSMMSGSPDWTQQDEGVVYRSIFSQIKDFDNNYYQNGQSGDYLSGLGAYHSNSYTTPSRPYTYKNNLEFTSQLTINKGPVRANLNLTAIVVDTLASKLASLSVMPQAVTNRGNPKGRELAENLNHLIRGLSHNLKISEIVNDAFKQAMICRVGYVKVVTKDDTVKLERVFSDEVLIDNSDGYYNDPQKLLQRRLVPKTTAKLMFPQFEEEIERVNIADSKQFNTRDYSPSIVIAEAWCKNTYLDKGRHVICIENHDLLDEEWDKDYFPVMKCDYNKPQIGFMGQSMVDELQPLQQEVDRLMVTIQAILKIMSVPRVFVDTNTNVNKQHWTNRLGLIIEYNGKAGAAPIIHNGASLAPELMQFLEFNVSQAYARAGLTTMDTQGEKAKGSGNMSGEAIKTEIDQKSERWQLLQKMYESKHVELMGIILKELRGKNIKVSSLDKMIGLKTVSSTIIPKVDDSFVLQVFPVSAMPKSIPDLMDSCEKLMNLGLINKAQMCDMFQIPDLDSRVAMISAPFKLVEKNLFKMIETKEYWNPEPYYELKYAAELSMLLYSWCEYNEEEEAVLKLLRRFINDVKKLTMKATPPPMPQPQLPVQAPQQPIPQQ